MVQFIDRYFDAKKEFGVIFIRLIIGIRLIHGTQDNVFSSEQMLEFRDFLQSQGFPFPLVSAHVSAYAQFICGFFMIIGFCTRLSSMIMIINFIIALLFVHIATTFDQSYLALLMLFASLFLLWNGAGKWSVDSILQRRRL